MWIHYRDEVCVFDHFCRPDAGIILMLFSLQKRLCILLQKQTNKERQREGCIM